jgi:hypothetical protein
MRKIEIHFSELQNLLGPKSSRPTFPFFLFPPLFSFLPRVAHFHFQRVKPNWLSPAATIQPTSNPAAPAKNPLRRRLPCTIGRRSSHRPHVYAALAWIGFTLVSCYNRRLAPMAPFLSTNQKGFHL